MIILMGQAYENPMETSRDCKGDAVRLPNSHYQADLEPFEYMRSSIVMLKNGIIYEHPRCLHLVQR